MRVQHAREREREEERAKSNDLALRIEEETTKQEAAMREERRRTRSAPLSTTSPARAGFAVNASEPRMHAELARVDAEAFETRSIPLRRPIVLGNASVRCIRRGPLLDSGTWSCLPR